jgi:hypothetical protein
VPPTIKGTIVWRHLLVFLVMFGSPGIADSEVVNSKLYSENSSHSFGGKNNQQSSRNQAGFPSLNLDLLTLLAYSFLFKSSRWAQTNLLLCQWAANSFILVTANCRWIFSDAFFFINLKN